MSLEPGDEISFGHSLKIELVAAESTVSQHGRDVIFGKSLLQSGLREVLAALSKKSDDGKQTVSGVGAIRRAATADAGGTNAA